MTKAELLERAAFWQAGLMDIDHLRDAAYEVVTSEFDSTEFRVLAGDAKVSPDDARDLLGKALRGAGLELPTLQQAKRIVSVSIARLVLAGGLDPMWAAEYVGHLETEFEELPNEVWGPLVYHSCPCCNGLDEMRGMAARDRRRAECRESIREHLREKLPALEAWAGVAGNAGALFLGWRRPLESARSERAEFDRRIRRILLKFWNPIGLGHGAPADEYDCCIGPVAQLMLSETSRKEVAVALERYLRDQEVNHFETSVDGGKESATRREVAIEELLDILPAKQS